MRGTFPSFLKEVVKTNDHCVVHVNQEAKLVGEVCPKKWGEAGMDGKSELGVVWQGQV